MLCQIQENLPKLPIPTLLEGIVNQGNLASFRVHLLEQGAFYTSMSIWQYLD